MRKLKLAIVLSISVFVLAACSPNVEEERTVGDAELTLEELAMYDGQNGNPAYIAVDGVIYDVTDIGAWDGGTHNGLTAGTDASDAIVNAPHGKSVLEELDIIGTLVEEEDRIIGTAELTLEELAMYNGQNGNPAYIAVNGTIYDVSDIGAWDGGTHNGITAGTDATSAITTAPHGVSILDTLDIIGTLVESEELSLTLEELAMYNGLNGNDAYVAVNGIIYDVTNNSEWGGGQHEGVFAGSDISDYINSAPHGDSVLSELPIVGTLVEPELMELTLAQLSMYNGQDGNPAYIAVNGTIYDVSDVGAWSGGTHNGVTAGTDATSAIMNAPHGESVLANLPIVGSLIE